MLSKILSIGAAVMGLAGSLLMIKESHDAANELASAEHIDILTPTLEDEEDE